MTTPPWYPQNGSLQDYTSPPQQRDAQRQEQGAPAPPVPKRLSAESYVTPSYERHASSALPAPVGVPRMQEFGGGYGHTEPPQSGGSMTRRPLPSQPPLGQATGLPPNPYPTSGSSGSMGARRQLPTPPSQNAPPPPPRPMGARQLPALPPVPRQERIPSGSSIIQSLPPPRPSYPPVDKPLPVPQFTMSTPPSKQQSTDRLDSVRQTPPWISQSPEPTQGYSSPTQNADLGSLSQPSSLTPSRTSTNASSYSSFASSNSSQRHSSGRSDETRPTSVEGSSGYGHDFAPLQKLEHGGGTNITLRPPSRGQNATPISAFDDGRRTPTPADRYRDVNRTPNPGLSVDPRIRTTSSSSLGVMDAGLPSTPSVVPERTLQHQMSLLDAPISRSNTPQSSSRISFPVPHLAPPSANAASGSSSSRPASTEHPDQTSADMARLSLQTSSRPPSTHSVVQRQPSVNSSIHPSIASYDRRRSSALSPSWASQTQQPSSWVERKLQIHQSHADDFYDDDESMRRPSMYEEDIYEEYEEEEEEEVEVNEIRFFQPAYLSEAALQLRDRVERSRQTKAGIAWVGAFTGRDIVSTIQSFLPPYTRDGPNDRRAALVMAQSLQNQLWYVEVDWDIKPLRDSSEDVFRFMGEIEGMGAGEGLASELPSGVMTMATKCYSPSCPGDFRCYASRCPFKTSPDSSLGRKEMTAAPAPSTSIRGEWTQDVDPFTLQSLTDAQYNRQNIIRKAIQDEIQYEADLAALEALYIHGLRTADPPVITPPYRLEMFIREIFSNESELHEACKRVIESFAIRERESAQRPLIQLVGDIYLQAAAEFRNIYPEYTGSLPAAEIALKKELDDNPEFRFFCERIVREHDRRRDIKYLITRPSTQLQRYPAVLEAILNATDEDDPDRDFLVEALSSIQSLSAISQLKLFHASKGRGPAGKMQWFDLVPEEQRNAIEKKEQKRQMQIWELIQGEMEYVADLETIDQLFVNGIRTAERGIVIERTRQEVFLDDVFHNYRSLLEVHSQLLDNLHARQLEQHPRFGMISDLLFDAALNWQEAYMEYVTHYPIAKAKVHEEEARNPKFAAFLKECLKDPSSNRQDIYHFINRPIPRLLRYNLLLADILKSLKETGQEHHPDIETIPQVIELISDLGKATQKGVAVNESKVELWTYQHSLDGSRYGPRIVKDLDLLNPMRELIHRGKVFRQPEGTISSTWPELTVLLFDNYFVLVKPEKQSRSSRREEKRVRYMINRRPIPLELLSLGNFSDAPRARSTKIFSVGSSHDADGQTEVTQDNKTVWPFTISFIGQGQLGGQYTLWTDSYATRADWQEKLLHAKVLRNEVNDANKVFEMVALSQDTFYMAPNYATPKTDGDSPYTGRVTCSCPFVTPDGRSLVAVGCDEGVWIGIRHDAKSLRKVLHVKAVTNIAVLEEFGIFLVLQDRTLLAYHLEALVPSASSPQVRAAPQRLSPGKDVVFFSVGQLSGRTLVLYMKKKGMDSLFRVLEPILGRNGEDANRQRRPFGNLLGQRAEWFRLYKDFFIPTEALNVHFLKHKLAVVCTRGFEIMDLTDLKGGSIPIFDPAKVRDRPHLAELQRRCESGKPLGMFRSTETEFLLCYDSFGIYVDRHGEPNRDCQPIDWEGRPDSVAFHPPYLLLCSSPFIEVRHIDHAKLLQIYTGSDIRLTWDGTGGQARPFTDNPGPNGYGDETSSQEPRLHICQRPERRGGFTQGIGQHVFELTPTLALNNPLLNPVHTHDSNYFPPAPLISHRPSSIMTRSTSEFYSGAGTPMTMMTTSGSGGYPGYGYGTGGAMGMTPARSEVSFESGTTGTGGGHGNAAGGGHVTPGW